MRIGDFENVWLVDLAYERLPGEVPTLTGLAAKSLRDGRLGRFGPGKGSLPAPPYSLGADALVVVYGASAALGCH